ncbi:MAG TPA: TRAP transporter substrate-binding protein [Xanthobacteraceae bacterium]|nr:TRAP transporter substrate-binding protein [Xanthobacteraceae bacterium]
MNTITHGRIARLIVAAGAFGAALTLPLVGAQAQGKAYEMKISTPTIHDVPDAFGANFLAAVEKDSGGRIQGQVYPASQLGSIPRQIEGTQFGSIQCSIIPPEFFVGIDQRFEVMAAPGLVNSLAQGEKVAADPKVRKLMLALGANKGLHGVAIFMAEPSDVISKNPIRHLADFKGKKLRTFASKFQTEAWSRLGATPVAMSLGDVLPALQQGTIDGAVAGMGPFTHMHFVDAAKYITMTDQPAIFLIVEINKKWYGSLPPDLQKIVDRDAAEQAAAIGLAAIEMRKKSQAAWTAAGGEEIKLPPDEQVQMMKTLSSVGADVSKSDPQLAAAYKVVTDAAARAAQTPSQ